MMTRQIKYLLVLFCLFTISIGCSTETNENIFIGDEPSIKTHLKQQDIESGQITIEELILHGEKLFTANFNSLDGFGRPQSSGNRTRRDKNYSQKILIGFLDLKLAHALIAITCL